MWRCFEGSTSAATIAAAPAGHGSEELLSDVLFLKRPFTAAEAMEQLPELNDEVDSIVTD